jgi:putative spermidine/putrescine transport system permease protein
MAQAAVGGRQATTSGPMVTASGEPLKVSLARAERRKRLTAFFLVVPLLTFILITFIVPIGDMALNSVRNPEVVTYLPRTADAIQQWNGADLPDEAVFEALIEDLKEGYGSPALGRVGARLNYEKSGMRSTIQRAGRAANRLEPPYRDSLVERDAAWGELDTWRIIQRESSPFTLSYFVAALDRTYDAEGNIVQVSPDQRIYVPLFIRTFMLSMVITALTLLLGFPIAYLMAHQPMRIANLLMILVLLPFWTSLLVRTSSWIVMLQQQGVLNDLLVYFGLIGNDERLTMVYNQTGTIVAMTHILLPFMVLPLYSVMKTIPPSYMRAARSLGATPWTAFWRVYVPQTTAGIGAGGVLVFIISIGYYITPALVGGQSGQMISNFIAFHMQRSLNWGLAAALGTILLFAVIVLYYLYNRLIGVDRLKLG